MLHAARLGYGHGDINRRWYHNHVRRRANLICIIDAVLQTNYCGIWPNKCSHLSRSRQRIVCLDAKKNQRAISDGAHIDRGINLDSLLVIGLIENKTSRGNRVGEMFSPNEDRRCARAGEHSTKIASHRAGADHCNSWPLWSFAHSLSLGSTTCRKS